MSTEPETKIFLAIPAMNESAWLPATLETIACQTQPPAKVFVCVNQPESWWAASDEQRAVCRDNRETIVLLNNYRNLTIGVIDRSSPGQGWQGKQSGAGWARKVLMDAINLVAQDQDILVSMDADTLYPPDYLRDVHEALAANPDAVALCAPFHHRLGPSEGENRALLRYELYMRHYFLNLARINSPYAFIALGSALALPVRSYRRIRGITPFKAGEDFYFLQKLRKTGRLLNDCASVVHPSPRVSARAGFGTGPAIGRGLAGDRDAYPFFPEACFEKVSETYRLFPVLYDRPVPTPMDAFLEKQFGSPDIWEPLRTNFKTRAHFVRACHEKIDGLRLLQFLKFCHQQMPEPPAGESVLASFVKDRIPERYRAKLSFDPGRMSFGASPVADLEALRNCLFEYELDIRRSLS